MRRLHRLVDPHRAPSQAWRTVLDGLLSPAAKLALLRLSARAALGDVGSLLARAERSAAADLSAAGLGDGLFVAGGHWDTPSIQGALASGRRSPGSARRTRRGHRSGVISGP